MEVSWFAFGLVFYCCIMSECMYAEEYKPKEPSDVQEHLKSTSATKALTSAEGEGKDPETADVTTLQEQLSEMQNVQRDILNALGDISQNIQHTNGVFIEKFEELNNQINEIREKVDALHNTGDETEIDPETAGKQLGNYLALMNASDLVDNINSIKQNVQEVKRSTALMTVTTVKKIELPYISHCERTGEDDEEKLYMDVCLQTRLAELYNDLSSVLQLHVMLVGGLPHEGRVEVIYNGRHGSICDYWFGTNEAKVVCRMLGYTGGESVCCGRLGKGKGEIMIGKLSCTGEETSLLFCKHQGIGVYEGDCNHDYDGGVICKP